MRENENLEPTEVDKARAQEAFEEITSKISQRDLNSDNLFEDLISEKAFELDRFTETPEPKASDELLEFAKSELADFEEEDK